MIKFLCKLLTSDNIIISTLYKELCKSADTAHARNWATSIRPLPNDFGFSHVWNNQNDVNRHFQADSVHLTNLISVHLLCPYNFFVHQYFFTKCCVLTIGCISTLFPVLKLVLFNYAARSTVNVQNSYNARKNCVNAWKKIAHDFLEYNRDPHIRKTQHMGTLSIQQRGICLGLVYPGVHQAEIGKK
jgi:hypothetical protein